MLLRLALAVALLVYAIPGFAQWRCWSDDLHQQRMKQNPAYAKSVAQAQADWNRCLSAAAYAREVITAKDTVYEIPVVVHIIHTGDPVGSEFNPSDAAIDSMIAYFNGAWQADWDAYADTSHGGIRMPFHFVLAKRDVACNAVSGITRNDGSVLSGYADYGICPYGLNPGPSDSAVKLLEPLACGRLPEYLDR